MDIGDSETPTPEAENRDAEFFTSFDPKEPFRELNTKAENKAGKSRRKTSKCEARRARSVEGKSKTNGARSKAD